MRRFAVLILGILGCGGGTSGEDLCKQLCECAKQSGVETCTPGGEKRCESEEAEAQKQADAAGCSAESQAVLDCAIQLTCKQHMTETMPCPDEAAALKACLAKGP